MTDATSERRVVWVRDLEEIGNDHLVVEEPMEIRLGGEPLAVVMRTPGSDEDLVLGFLITEGIVSGPGAVAGIESIGAGRMEVRLASGHVVDPEQFKRNFYSTSSCGVCGKASIDAIRIAGAVPPAGPIVDASKLSELPDLLYEKQPAFHATGGLHAAGAFNQSGEVVAVREDVGRHNATDKVVGHLASASWPLPSLGLVVSGRVSFEIVQKAAVSGISLVCGVSAASTLAVDLAEEFGMTVVGFLRDGGFTLYTGEQRVRR